MESGERPDAAAPPQRRSCRDPRPHTDHAAVVKLHSAQVQFLANPARGGDAGSRLDRHLIANRKQTQRPIKLHVHGSLQTAAHRGSEPPQDRRHQQRPAERGGERLKHQLLAAAEPPHPQMHPAPFWIHTRRRGPPATPHHAPQQAHPQKRREGKQHRRNRHHHTADKKADQPRFRRQTLELPESYHGDQARCPRQVEQR